jgi:hypothetical protein
VDVVACQWDRGADADGERHAGIDPARCCRGTAVDQSCSLEVAFVHDSERVLGNATSPPALSTLKDAYRDSPENMEAAEGRMSSADPVRSHRDAGHPGSIFPSPVDGLGIRLRRKTRGQETPGRQSKNFKAARPSRNRF